MKLVAGFHFAITLLFSIALPAQADWVLEQGKSTMSFVTVKNGMIAEAHSFKKLSGRVSQDGLATLEVDLASVDTLIPIRDERMREMLFDTANFPTANITVQLDGEILRQLQSASATKLEVFGNLEVRGQTQRISASLVVGGSKDGGVLVSTDKPVLVAANQFDLLNGVEKLREVAGLSSITPVVPVSFALRFKPTKARPKASTSQPKNQTGVL